MSYDTHLSDKRTLTPGEVAKLCDVHLRTVTRWISQGHLKAYKLPGRGNNRIEFKDFLAFLKKHSMPIPQELLDQEVRVLVVDDDLATATSIARVLKRQSYTTQMAHDGFEAGIAVATFKPHVITLDLQMPGADGYEVIELIRKKYPESAIKILVVSALHTGKLQQAVDRGADDYLEKPYEISDLIYKVKSLAPKIPNINVS